MAAGTLKLVKTLIIAAKVVGFDETTLRSGAAGEKKFVHGAFTDGSRCSTSAPGRWRPSRTSGSSPISPGSRSLTVRQLLPHDMEDISGHQACLSHILRDLQDCAESYPASTGPPRPRKPSAL